MKTQTKNIIALSTIVTSTVLTLGAVKVTAENLDHNKKQNIETSFNHDVASTSELNHDIISLTNLSNIPYDAMLY